MLEQADAQIGTEVEMIGQGRRGQFLGEPIILTIVDNDLAAPEAGGKVTCAWIDKELHLQQAEFKLAVLKLND